MEQKRKPEEEFIINDEYSYQRFSKPGVSYLRPLSPSSPQMHLQETFDYLREMKLINFNHTKNQPIPLYSLPEIILKPLYPDEQMFDHIHKNVAKLSETLSDFSRLATMLADEDKYAYRGAKVTVEDLELEEKKLQLNKLHSLSTYGLDYPPQNGSHFAVVSMSINELLSAVYFLRQKVPLTVFPKLEAKYSLLMIYKANGLDYTAEPLYYDIDGKRSPQSYGVKIIDEETLRDKLQAVVFIPWGTK